MNKQQMRALVGGFGGLLIAVGSFLPWITATAAFVGSVSVSGLDGGGDGTITLIVGIAVMVFAVVVLVGNQTGTAWGFPMALGGLIAGGVAIVNLVEVSDRITEANVAFGEFGRASAGAGLWTVLVGAAAALVGGLTVAGSASRASSAPRGPADIPAPPPFTGASGLASNPGAIRECPYCKESMRRDASVCPHCRRESPAWRYESGRWWSVDAQQNEVWYDERGHVWRGSDEQLAQTGIRGDTYAVVLESLSGADHSRIRKLVRDFVPERVVADEEFEHMPVTLCDSVGYATAEGLRIQLARRGALAHVEDRRAQISSVGRLPEPPA